MFDPKMFVTCKKSKTEILLHKHGYQFKCYFDKSGKRIEFLERTFNNPYDRIANTNDFAENPTERIDGSIVMNDGETRKEFFIRLGWIDENGNIVE